MVRQVIEGEQCDFVITNAAYYKLIFSLIS